jgi:hypothetical protein
MTAGEEIASGGLEARNDGEKKEPEDRVDSYSRIWTPDQVRGDSEISQKSKGKSQK